MQAYLAEVSADFNAGMCSGMCTHTACALALCHSAMAAKLLAAHGTSQSFERWAFFISDGDKRRCIQLTRGSELVHVDVSAAAAPQYTAEQGMGARTTDTQQEHRDMLEQEKQQMAVRGELAAQMILDKHPNHFAALTLVQMSLPGFDQLLHFHMWRKDILSKVQSQLGLPDAASVPLKVWRRLNRTSYAGTINLSLLPTFSVVVDLICWQCGAMSANAKQCGRCRIAWYCSRDCQRAQHDSHRRWCGGVADELQLRRILAESPKMLCCIMDGHAAMQRSPEALALSYQVSRAVQPAQGGSAAVAASASGAAAAQATTGQGLPEQPAGVESDP